MDHPLLYAIGDVHGRADLLAGLLDAIDVDARRAGAEPGVMFLGDIIDRGPDSFDALELVGETLKRWPSSRLLLGNHDDALLSFFKGDSLGGDWFGIWLGQGGRETLLSYGVDPDDPKDARRMMRGRHDDHRQILQAASLMEIDTDFAFVHAGINPNRSLDSQTRRDCLNIRSRFMNHVGRLERIVIHGHTPQRPPRAVATENRISLDTGAYFSDVLTALVVDSRTRRIETIATSPGCSTLRGSPDRLDRGFGTAIELFRGAA
jgi:serine/threonine protein phosphatase 1